MKEKRWKKKTRRPESEEGVHFIYVVMIVIAEAEKGKSRKKSTFKFSGTSSKPHKGHSEG